MPLKKYKRPAENEIVLHGELDDNHNLPLEAFHPSLLFSFPSKSKTRLFRISSPILISYRAIFLGSITRREKNRDESRGGAIEPWLLSAAHVVSA